MLLAAPLKADERTFNCVGQHLIDHNFAYGFDPEVTEQIIQFFMTQEYPIKSRSKLTVDSVNFEWPFPKDFMAYESTISCASETAACAFDTMYIALSRVGINLFHLSPDIVTEGEKYSRVYFSSSEADGMTAIPAFCEIVGP